MVVGFCPSLLAGMEALLIRPGRAMHGYRHLVTPAVPLAAGDPELVVKQPLRCPGYDRLRDHLRAFPFARVAEAETIARVDVRERRAAGALEFGRDDDDLRAEWLPVCEPQNVGSAEWSRAEVADPADLPTFDRRAAR